MSDTPALIAWWQEAGLHISQDLVWKPQGFMSQRPHRNYLHVKKYYNIVSWSL